MPGAALAHMHLQPVGEEGHEVAGQVAGQRQAFHPGFRHRVRVRRHLGDAAGEGLEQIAHHLVGQALQLQHVMGVGGIMLLAQDGAWWRPTSTGPSGRRRSLSRMIRITPSAARRRA